MFEFVAGILALCLAVLIWAAIGHGIWVLLAKISRALFGSGEAPPRSPCRACGSRSGVERGHCRFCGAAEVVTPSPPPSLVEELHGTLKQLDRLWRRGIITDDEHTRLIAACERDLNRLTGPSPLPAASPIAAPVVFSPSTAAPLVAAPDIIEAEIVYLPPKTPAPVVASVPPAVHPLDRADEPVVPPSPPPRRAKRALADVLAAFMQERNIRWGELVSGLLIVGSAAGLILSLRDQLREWIPYFPAFLFLLATSAIHAAGLYTLRKWNLQSTSRGVLIISLLLVPLNFLAAILISGDTAEHLPVMSVTYIAAVSVGLVAFATICITGAQALVGRQWPVVALAVFGTSATQLVINRVITDKTTAAQALWLGGVACGCFIVAILLALSHARRYRRLSFRRAEPLLLTLGLGGFALALPMALLLSKSVSLWQTISTLSPIFAILGATIVATGEALAGRARARVVAPLAILGTSLAVLGGFVMLAAVGFAWPEPTRLMFVGAVCTIALGILAWFGRLPLLQAPAVASATLVSLVALHYWQGRFDVPAAELAEQILYSWRMGRSGLLLALLAGAVFGLAYLLTWRGAKDFARVLMYSAAALTVVSLINAAAAGFLQGPDAELTTLVFAVNALALTSATFVRPLRWFTIGAAAQWLIALVHAVGFNEPVRAWLEGQHLLAERPVLLATLVLSCIYVAVAGVVAAWKKNSVYYHEVARPLAIAAFVASLSTVLFAVLVREQQFGLHAGYVLAIASVWLLSATILRSPELVTAGQAMALWGLVYAALAVAQQQAWWGEWRVDPRAIALVATTLACACAGMAIVRRMSERWPSVHALLSPPWPGVDQAVMGVLVLGVVAGCGVAVGQGVLEEMQFSRIALTADSVEYLATFRHWTIWMAVIALSLSLFVALWDRFDIAWVALLLLLALVPCELFCLGFIEVGATASALRWSLMAYLLVMTAIFCGRRELRWLLEALPISWRGRDHAMLLPVGVGLVMAVSAIPIVALTLIACITTVQGVGPRTPAAETFFGDISVTVSYVVPLCAVLLSLLTFGLRERHAGFIVAASAVWQLIVSLACLMPVLMDGGTWDAALSVSLWQFNAIGMGLFTLLWMALSPWLGDRAAFAELRKLQIGGLIALIAGLAVWATVSIIGRAPMAMAWPELPFGTWHSYLALALTAAVIAWYRRTSTARESSIALAIWGASAMSLIAASFAPFDAAWPWTSYRVLLSGWLLTAGTAAVLSQFIKRPGIATVTATLLASIVAGLSFFSGWNDPIAWWAMLINVGVLAVFIGLGLSRRQAGYDFASVALTIMTASQAYYQFVPRSEMHFADFIAANIVATVAICALWLAIEIERERSAGVPAGPNWLPSVPLTLTPIVTVVAAGYIAIGRLLLLSGARIWVQTDYASSLVSFAMMAVVGAYLFATLWYDRQRVALVCLYVWGLCIAVMCCNPMTVPPAYFLVGMTTAVAAYIAFTGWVWYSSARLASLGQHMGIHDPIRGLERVSRWLPVVSIFMACLIALLDSSFVLGHPDMAVRYVAGFGPVLLAIGFAMQAQLERRATMIYLSLLSATYAAVLLGSAELPPGLDETLWLRRSIRVLLVLGALAIVYSTVLPRFWSQLADWMLALRRMSVTCAIIAGAALFAVLALEVAEFLGEQAGQLTNGEVAVVAVVLVMLTVTLIVLALSKKTGLPLSDTQRMGCVYGAQLILALAFAHLYFTRPWWFDGLLKPYWPYIVMAIAFAGVGVGEWLQRMRLRILAEPLQRTGTFLPLLPALGWWIEASRGTPTTDYSFVMFTVGLLYVMISVVRGSVVSGITAGVAGNVALWSLMAEKDWNFAERPQFWLIPPALSVLGGVQANHKRLSEEQLTAARYACLLIIYLSSTSEIFINGIESLWPPLILLALAIVGVLAGMVLQVRAFLYVGTSFVFLSMVTMVWHASRAFNQVWPWWVFGICVGLAMLVFFGLFEKKRAEITALVDRLRQWEH